MTLQTEILSPVTSDFLKQMIILMSFNSTLQDRNGRIVSTKTVPSTFSMFSMQTWARLFKTNDVIS